MLAGAILAQAATYDERYVVETQEYGPEARLGATKAELVIASRPIAYPLVDADGRRRTVNQIELLCRKLVECPHTRRAQATTWRPGYDHEIEDPPCLQRIWARLVPPSCEDDASNRSFALQMHTYWRSRDLYKAWFFNVVAMTELQAFMAKRISELGGFDVSVGEYHDTADSLHIYGSYFGEALPRIEKMRDGDWRSRSVNEEKMEIWREIMSEQKAALSSGGGPVPGGASTQR